MSWNHIQQIMKDLGGSAIIIEDGAPRYVVVPIEEWDRVQASKGHVQYADVDVDDDDIEYEELTPEFSAPTHPFAESNESSLEYEESPLGTLDTFESPSYPV